MNKTELASRVASRASLSRADADRAVNAMLSAIGDALANGETVRIAGFSTFSTRARTARQDRNPRTGGGGLPGIAAQGTLCPMPKGPFDR